MWFFSYIYKKKIPESMETQTEPWEDVTQETIGDVVDT